MKQYYYFAFTLSCLSLSRLLMLNIICLPRDRARKFLGTNICKLRCSKYGIIKIILLVAVDANRFGYVLCDWPTSEQCGDVCNETRSLFALKEVKFFTFGVTARDQLGLPASSFYIDRSMDT